MSSKRSCAQVKEMDTKRAKTAEAPPYETRLGGAIYVDEDSRYKFTPFKNYFAKKYKRSVAALIKDESLQAISVTRTNADNGNLVEKKLYAPKSDVRLVRKDARIAELILTAERSSYGVAPPVLEDHVLSFFVDKSGKEYKVEMRGTRTMEGILFRIKDVGAVFESPLR